MVTLILEQLNEDNGFLEQLEFTDGVTFHISGTVNHNIRIQVSEKPHLVLTGLDIICQRYFDFLHVLLMPLMY
jgi:hypothetical protein